MPTDPYYYQSKLRELQGQKALTTGRGLTPEETTGILNAELEARYTAEDRRRQYALQQEQLAIQKDANKRAAQAAEQQAMAATVGGVGQLALGGAALYGTGKQAGWWGATPAITTPATAIPTTTGTAAGLGYTELGTAGTVGTTEIGTGGTALMNLPAAPAGTTTATGGVSSVALPAAAAVADIWSAETIRRGTSSYGRGGQSGTPWADDTGWGVFANLVFPLPGAIGGIAGSIKGGVEKATSTVICTELHRQGLLPSEILNLDSKHRQLYIDDDTYNGYTSWAKYIVKGMQKSKLFTRLIAPIVQSWAYEMASRIDNKYQGNITGKILMLIGVPICRFIGKVQRRGYRWPIYYKA